MSRVCSTMHVTDDSYKHYPNIRIIVANCLQNWFKLHDSGQGQDDKTWNHAEECFTWFAISQIARWHATSASYDIMG